MDIGKEITMTKELPWAWCFATIILLYLMCSELSRHFAEKKARLREPKLHVQGHAAGMRQLNLKPGLVRPEPVFSTPRGPAQCHEYLIPE